MKNVEKRIAKRLYRPLPTQVLFCVSPGCLRCRFMRCLSLLNERQTIDVKVFLRDQCEPRLLHTVKRMPVVFNAEHGQSGSQVLATLQWARQSPHPAIGHGQQPKMTGTKLLRQLRLRHGGMNMEEG